jgi:hypothetical protein
MLLDFITVFCLVGGCLLLWLNLRPRRDQVIIAKSKPAASPPKLTVDALPVAQEKQNNEPLKSEDKRMDKPFFDMLRQHLSEAEPAGPVGAADVAGEIAKSKTSKAP